MTEPWLAKRDLDAEIDGWLEDNPNANADELAEYLRETFRLDGDGR